MLGHKITILPLVTLRFQIKLGTIYPLDNLLDLANSPLIKAFKLGIYELTLPTERSTRKVITFSPPWRIWSSKFNLPTLGHYTRIRCQYIPIKPTKGCQSYNNPLGDKLLDPFS